MKTTGHAAQLGVYELLAAASYGVRITAPAHILGLQAGKTAGGQRAGSGTVENARARLVGDEDSPGLLHHAAALLHAGRFYGNPRSQTCHPRYCPAYATCRWR